MTPRTRLVVGAALVALIAVIVHAPTFANGAVWDDADLVVDNPYLRTWAGVRQLLTHDLWTASARHEASSFYRPLPMLTYAANRLVGGSASIFHAGNIALHAACCAALLALAAAQATRAQLVSATFGAALFAVAPLNVESVAWISARFDILGTALVICALWANGGRGVARAGVAAGATSAALFCKEAFIVAIPLLVLHDVVMVRRPPWRHWPKHMACLAAAVAFFALRSFVGVTSMRAVEATGPLALAEGYAFLIRAFVTTTVYPEHLDPFRAYTPPATGALWLIGGAAALTLGALAVRAARRAEDARARALVFGVGWALLALAPASLTGPNLDIVGDRYAYFPLAGIAFSVAALGAYARPRAESLVAGCAASVLIVLFAVRTAQRTADWRDERTLFSASVADDARNPYALYMLGALHVTANEVDLGAPLLERSLKLQPRSWRAHNALCVARLRQGRLDAAERQCRASADLRADNPRVWINLASIAVRRGDWATGLEHATHAARVGPFAAEGHYLRAACLANLGELEKARSAAERAIAVGGDHAGSRDLLAQLQAHGAAGPR